MKKIIVAIWIIFILFSNSLYASWNKQEVDAVMNKFYSKLDSNLPDIDDRIYKLTGILNKIETIKVNKKNRLSQKSKELLQLMTNSLLNKKEDYKNMQKEDLDISDILWEDDFNNIGKPTIVTDSIWMVSGGSYEKTYWDLKKSDNIKMWSFTIKWWSDDNKVALSFASGPASRVHFSKVYLKWEDWKIIIAPSPNAVVKTFEWIDSNKNYILYGEIEKVISWNEFINISFFEIEWKKFKVINGTVWKIEFWK